MIIDCKSANGRPCLNCEAWMAGHAAGAKAAFDRVFKFYDLLANGMDPRHIMIWIRRAGPLKSPIKAMSEALRAS